MSPYGGETGLIGEGRGCPLLLAWQPGTILPELAPGEIRAWVVDLDAGLSPENVDLAEPGPEFDLLAEDEQARAVRFVRARDRRRFVCCRAALRKILGGLLCESPGSLRIRAGGQGKPELDPPGPGAGRSDA